MLPYLMTPFLTPEASLESIAESLYPYDLSSATPAELRELVNMTYTSERI